MPIQFSCPHCGTETNVSDEYSGQTGPCAACGKSITVPELGVSYPQERKSTSGGVIVLVIVAVVVMVLLVCGGIGTALLLPAVQQGREAARRMQCSNNMKQIGLALHNYITTEGTLPPAYLADEDGTPMHSWRTLILPYLGEQMPFAQYDFEQPWDSPINRSVTSRPIEVYQCPSSGLSTNETNYVMIVGPDAISNGTKGLNFADIRDGTSVTAMVIEVVNSGIAWAEPRDLTVDDLQSGINGAVGKSPSSRHVGGVQVLFADGAIRFLSDGIPPEVLVEMVNRDDGSDAVIEWTDGY